ncbi:Laminin subunit alpha-2 [Mactra antiquata]
MRLACVCQHNTCGSNCERCCPLFNQKPWIRGGKNDENGEIITNIECEACNCHGHADSCVYNATVDALGLSMNMNGDMKGGGVCINCTDDTTGINCEKCLPGYYRPWGVSHNSRRPCRQCNCETSIGSTGICVEDDSRVDEGLMPGSCICKEGFGGQNCDQCAPGYHSYPYCEPCSCSLAGTVDPDMCEGRCVCKANVAGTNCDSCKPGYYDLDKENDLGCRQCFCFGISTVCQSAGLGLVQISDMSAEMDGWTVITLNDRDFTYFPNLANGWLEYRTFPAREQNVLDVDRSVRDPIMYYWQAPVKYYGNRLASYGGQLHYTMMFTIDESAPIQNHDIAADVILQGANITVSNGRNYLRENQENVRSVTLEETEWYELDPDSGRIVSREPVSRKDFMILLYDLRRILIRATHHTAQDNVKIKDVLLDTSNAGSTSDVSITGVEKCSCPRGYTGLSCESCDIGWRRLDNVLYKGQCIPCECYGHSKTCDPYTGRCLMCTDNTEGENCEFCRPGFYGDPTRGTPDDCKPCSCPLTERSNNFATTCVLNPTFNDPDAFVCLDCAPGFAGERCERCDNGYYGYPGLLGSSCQQCECNGNIDRDLVGSCDQLTGECLLCQHNTEGPNCGKCMLGYYGTALNGDCKLCDCDPFGSLDLTCNRDTGKCECKNHYTGRQCDRCEENYWGLESGEGCQPCDCDPVGSYFSQCDSQTGMCRCKRGVSGRKCDECKEGYYGLISKGECLECEPCNKPGHICHPETGECVCPPNTEGEKCEQCIDTFWGYDPRKGCKSCDCDPIGSFDNNCDPLSGQCVCKADYTGLQCDRCLSGFYNFPDCMSCLCSVEGTQSHTCNPQGSCDCREPDGQCECKSNTLGRTCAECVDGSFSLDKTNPDGCTDCFCFGRSNGTCRQAQYVWSKMELPDMSVKFSDQAKSIVERTQTGFSVIPQNESWTRDISGSGDPVYWRLPNVTGDMTLSYNGYLSFTVEYGPHPGDSQLSNLDGYIDKPLVVLAGYDFSFMYRSDVRMEPYKGNEFKVRLHEHYWRTRTNGDVSRQMMMIVLQNVSDILVRATWDDNIFVAEIRDIELDVAVDNTLQLGEPALGIEECVCLEQYSGLSCQDPAEGYYRLPYPGPIDIGITDPSLIIGEVRPCECNDHGTSCNPETGACYNCEHNTKGDQCEQCMDGYYGDPTTGNPNACKPCACPLEIVSNNFSPTCELVNSDLICTACQEGYTGDRCEFCKSGYYGNPTQPGGKCEPCNCNSEGSVLEQCNNDGICQCLPGIEGDKCDQCQPRYAVIQGQCQSCDQGCTRELMMDMDDLEFMIETLPFDPSNVNVSVPYKKLNMIRNETKILSSEGAIENTNKLAEDGSKLLRDADEIEDTIDLLKLNVETLVNDLEDSVAASFHNRSGINVTASLNEAQKILEEIKNRDFSEEADKSSNEANEAERLSDRLTGIAERLTDVSETEDKITMVTDALDDLLDQLEKSLKNAENSIDKQDGIKNTIMNIRQLLNETKSMNKGLSQTGLDKQLSDARDALNRTDENIRTLELRASTLDAAIKPLSDKETMLREGLEGKEELVDKAMQHALNLSKTADDLAKLFENTKLEAEEPLKAARIFENIVKAIDEAEAAAKKADADAINASSLTDYDQLRKDVEAALKESKKLRKTSETLGNDVEGLDNAIEDVNSKLDNIDLTQLDSIDKHTEIVAEIDQLPRDIVDRLSEVSKSISITETMADRVNEKTGEMVDKVNNEMMPKLKELQDVVGDKFEDVYDTLSGTKTNLDDMRNITDSIDGRIDGSKRMRSDLRDKLSKLKQSIREAREEANKVKTSLMSEGQCVKKFHSLAQAGTINTISFAFKTREPEKDMLIVLIQNPEVNAEDGDLEKEFLAVEIRNRKIRFSWNVGKGTGSVDSDIEIQSENAVIKEVDKWYQIKAERIGRLGRLYVYKVSDTVPAPRTSSSPVGSSVMGLGSHSDVFVSGVPNGYVIPDTLTRFNFSGCMGSFFVDDQLLGLFNFETNTMDTCKACLEVPSQEPGTGIYSFDGTGYAVSSSEVFSSLISVNLVVDFKTVWDNASLFFVGDEDSGEFMSLELRNGKIVFSYYLGAGTYGYIETELKYNRNKWVNVAIARSGYFALLAVENEKKIVEAPDGDYQLEGLVKTDFYFGGAPPSVNMDKYREKSGQTIITDSFLGCLGGLQIELGAVNLWDGTSTVGVTEGCKDSGVRSIGFYGAGFAEYLGISLDSVESDLSISFSTREPNAMLMLAKDINDDKFYSLALIDGHVEGWFSGGSTPKKIKSDDTFNDGKLHNIAVKKTNRRLELYVDDKKVGEDRLQNGFAVIEVREDGGLYLGGVPGTFDVSTQVGTHQTLDGCLSDVIINGKVLNLNELKQYDRADLGRCRNRNIPIEGSETNPPPVASDAPSPIRMPEDIIPVTKSSKKDKSTDNDMVSDETIAVPTTPGPTSCAAYNNYYDYENDAYAFGEEENSFNQINVSQKEIARNFDLSFDFRTYYKDGLLFYLSNLDHTAFLAGQLRDGTFVLVFDWRGSVKETKVDIESSLSDGEWHSVLVDKNKQRISVTLDGVHKKGSKITKVLKVDVPLFVGGVPTTFLPLMKDQVIQHSVRGCMRNLLINNNLKTFSDTTLASGVDKCFAKVENGVHLTGISYAIYVRRFEVTDSLVIDLEFRTAKQEGILTTASNGNGRHAFTLELNDGQVKLSLISNGELTIVSTKYDSEYQLCDNEWHKISAKIQNNGISLQVDGQKPINRNIADLKTKISAPLYIGGKSASSNQAAAMTTTGFTGCLRNVYINTEPVDWFNLVHSVHVHKTSCPLS